MSDKPLIQHPYTITNGAISRACGETDPYANAAFIETSFVRAVTLRIEDEAGVVRSYAYSEPVFFWLVDMILDDDTRVPIAASGDFDDIARIAEWSRTAGAPDNPLPIIDKTKAGRA